MRRAAYEPLYRSRPSHRWTNGDLAAKVGADLGLPPDPEQQWLLDSIYAERAPERPAAFEVAVIGPRQNIKTSTLGTAALADLFVFGVERHLWTAHHGDTLKGTFSDFRAWIKSNPEYDEQVTFYEGHQDMSIVHKDTGHVIDFQSRTGKAGRGLTGVKRITLDEALYLEPKHVGAVYPTMLTRPGAQVRIGSSAGLVTSEQLRRIRDRGRLGKDSRLAYVEYGARLHPCAERGCSHAVGTEGCAYDDPELWWQANCALWAGRVLEESIADQRKAMPPDEFAREFLSQWEDPLSVGGALDLDAWLRLADPSAPRGDILAFGVDLDGSRLCHIGVAWDRDDEGRQVMLTQDDEGRVDTDLTVSAAAQRLAHLHRTYGGPVALGGPAVEALKDQLDELGVETVVVSNQEFAGSCGDVGDGVRDGSLHHGNQPELNRSASAARWRSAGVSGERAFELKETDGIGPMAAVTRAVHALSTTGGVLVW